jgi:hypothetical protein
MTTRKTAPQYETNDRGQLYYRYAGPYRDHETAMEQLWDFHAEGIICEAEGPFVKHNAVYFPA